MRRRVWRRALATLCLGGLACGPATRAGHLVAAASPELVDVTLLLIGDAGAPAAPPDSEPVLMALRAAAAAASHPFIVFLGDNVYPRGLPDSGAPDRPEAERRLTAQIAVLRATGARGMFVPGNHDWDKQAAGGWDAVRRQGRFIAAAGLRLLPGDGCPGPAVVDVGQAVRIVALDTQWWLDDGPKPQDPTSSCPADSRAEVIDSLRASLATAAERVVVVVAHHPLLSSGPHGGHFGWKDHLFPLRAAKSWLWLPLPLIGSAYPIARKEGISSQDESSAAYRAMRSAFDSAFHDRPPLIYAAGHEHALQVITGTSARYVLVSGAGIFGHTEPVAMREGMRYARSASGFMRVDVLRDGRARLGVMVVNRAGIAAEAYSLWLN
ncbi:MAG TPA: metallophosphoesterase [Gemmatimonadales bacterium]|nr:metallophosphoesterase [Gemmatimonadales bacterium]